MEREVKDMRVEKYLTPFYFLSRHRRVPSAEWRVRLARIVQ